MNRRRGPARISKKAGRAAAAMRISGCTAERFAELTAADIARQTGVSLAEAVAMLAARQGRERLL